MNNHDLIGKTYRDPGDWFLSEAERGRELRVVALDPHGADVVRVRPVGEYGPIYTESAARVRAIIEEGQAQPG